MKNRRQKFLKISIIFSNKKEYLCPNCPKAFNQRVAYNMHLKIHTGKELLFSFRKYFYHFSELFRNKTSLLFRVWQIIFTKNAVKTTLQSPQVNLAEFWALKRLNKSSKSRILLTTQNLKKLNKKIVLVVKSHTRAVLVVNFSLIGVI